MEKIKDIRNMLITYDNVIQSTDYGFLQFIINKSYQGGFKDLFFLSIFKKMTRDERLFALLHRKEKDLFKVLSNNKVNEDNCLLFGIDKYQDNEEYFNDVIISEFASKLPILLANKSIDKLYISVDWNNKYKLKILGDLFNEYKDIVTVIDTNKTDEYIQSKKINTIVTTDEIAFRNIEYLHNKSIMIMDCEYIYDILDASKIELGSKAKITKHRWEERNDLTISFIPLYKFNKLRKIEIR